MQSNNRLRRIMLANREGTSWTFDALGVIGGITFDAAGRVFFSSVVRTSGTCNRSGPQPHTTQ